MDYNTFLYVTSAPFFWLSMGMATMIAIFVGAIIYDGDLSNAYKGVLSVLIYVMFLFETTLLRVNDLFARHPEFHDSTRYGGLLTILMLTGFWLFGILLGVLTSRFIVHRCKGV